MLSDQDLSAAIGSTAYGPDGDAIGTVEHFFLDDRTGQPTWVAVTTGLFGTRHSIVPALQATFTEGGLRVPVDKEAVRSAPALEATEHLDPVEEAHLRRHYGLESAGLESAGLESAGLENAGLENAGLDNGALAGGGRDVGDRDASARAAGTATDSAMTRSEERLRVSTERVATKRIRVVKYVVTEEVQVTVALRREEIRIEELPLDAPGDGDTVVTEGEALASAGTASAGMTSEGMTSEGTASDGRTSVPGGLPEEIILHREEPVISVRVVPTERVRLRTHLVQDQEQVSAQLRQERITVEEDPVTPTADS